MNENATHKQAQLELILDNLNEWINKLTMPSDAEIFDILKVKIDQVNNKIQFIKIHN